MKLIDTHTHLFSTEFDIDRTEVVNRAIEKGVTKMLLPNIDFDTIEPMLAMCKQFPENCYAMLGLHPTSVKADFAKVLNKMFKKISEERFIAIGEVGLDLFWDKTFFKEQCDALKIQIDWAREFNLPIVLHTRDAYPEMLALLKNYKQNEPYKGVFHSFVGSIEDANAAIGMGFFIGLNGVLTFKNSKLFEVVEQVSLDHIILETDSPYLTPVPKRGQRNESSYVTYIAQKVADIKNLALSEVIEKTTSNALALFKI
jgi:TatD DNase family protein